MKRLMFALVAAITLVTAFTGCRTARGAGEDIENAGEAVQDATR